jgi:lipoprotein NlpI
LKHLIAIAIVLLAGCSNSNSADLTYEELVYYHTDCKLAGSQLDRLKQIQRNKNFDPDPDKLNDADRAYNSRLKATIWWYYYECNNL